MRKFVLLSSMLSLVIWLACSGDDDNGVTPPPGPPRVVAFAAATAPSPSDVDDPLWDSAAATTISVPNIALSLRDRPPASGHAPQGVADQVVVRAITHSDTLYLRITWSDATFDCWRERWEVVDTAAGAATFQRADPSVVNEDQLLLLFSGLPDETWDAWHWRVVTTAIADLGSGMATGFAEGGRYQADSLLIDDGDQAIARENGRWGGTFDYPQYIHRPIGEDSCGFDGYILYHPYPDSAFWLEQIIHMPNCWTPGRLIPGIRIDSSMAIPGNTVKRASRWNVWTVSEWIDAADQYTVVLRRAVNTGFTDDLAMVDSVKALIGLTDNADFALDRGDTDQGFTPEFWLVFP